MLVASNVKNVIITTEGAEVLKGANNVLSSAKLEDYIKFLNVDNHQNKYRIIVEFNDETFASVKLS